jgi:hypothetical protein
MDTTDLQLDWTKLNRSTFLLGELGEETRRIPFAHDLQPTVSKGVSVLTAFPFAMASNPIKHNAILKRDSMACAWIQVSETIGPINRRCD